MSQDTDPALDAATFGMKRRFNEAIEDLTNDFGRLLAEIAEHPRHNDKVARTRAALEILHGLAVITRRLADENVPHPNSRLGRDLRADG